MPTISKRLFGPARLTNAAATKYTVPGNTTAKITRMRVSNPTGAPVNFTFSIGADGASTRLYSAVPVPAGQGLDLLGPWNLETSEFVQSFASSNNALVLEINGSETSDPQAVINGVVYGDSMAGTSGITAGQSMSAQLQLLRPSDTWNRVSVGALECDNPGGGAIGPGSFSFENLVHDVYYIPGARNVVVLWSILHGTVNDTSLTATQAYDRYRVLVQIAQGLGWEVVATTIPGTTEYNNPASSPYRRPQRIGVNDLLLSGDGGSRPPNAGAEYLANIEAIPGLGQSEQPVSGNPGGVMLQADGIHPTAVAQAAGASAVSAALAA